MKKIYISIFASLMIVSCVGEKEGKAKNENKIPEQDLLENNGIENDLTLCDCVEVEKMLNKEMSKIDYNDSNVDERLSVIQDKYIADIENCEKIVTDLRNKGLSEPEFNRLINECN